MKGIHSYPGGIHVVTFLYPRVCDKKEIGRRCGNLTITGFWYSEIKYGTRDTYWFCDCDCGERVYASSSCLFYSRKKSCGCLFTNEHAEIIGKRFGIMTVKSVDRQFKDTGRYKIAFALSRNSYFTCECDCGEIFRAQYLNIKKFLVTSCGCLRYARLLAKNTVLNPEEIPHELVKLKMATCKLNRIIKEKPANV